jgi:hypothetical protein
MWPDFGDRYQPSSFIGRLHTERGKLLKVAQQYHEQIQEVRRAKSTGQPANVPDVAVRRQKAREAQKTLQAVAKARQAVDEQVFSMRLNLKPYDYSSKNLQQINIMNRHLDLLLDAKDDKERLQMMQKAHFREAAFQGGPELSGLSEQTYNRLYGEELARKFPVEMQTIADFETASETFSATMKAAELAVANELKAIAEPWDETVPSQKSADWAQ